MNRRLKLMLAGLCAAVGLAAWRASRPTGPGAVSYRAALGAQERGDLPAAVAGLRQAILREPGNGEYHADLGNLYLQQARYEDATAELQEAAYLSPRRPHLYCQLAQALVEERRRDDALAAIETALKKTPDCPHALSVQGEQSLRDDNLAAALTSFQKVIRLQPDFALAYQKVGHILLEANRPAEALPVLQKGLSVSPNHPGIHFLVGEAFRRQPGIPHASELAEQHYRLALKDNPDAARAHAALGAVLRMRGDLRGARAEYEQALAVSPGLGEALYGIAQVAQRQQRPAEASRYLQQFQHVQTLERGLNDLKARALAGRDPGDAGLRLARTCLDKGLLKEAERTLDAVVAADPARREGRELRGRLYQESGRPGPASREFAIASRLPVREP